MNPRRLLLLNLGHALDHLFMLLFPAVAALAAVDIGDSYGSVLVLATGSFIAFGACSLPAGWLGDRWGRERMMLIFFTGIGGASILTGFATSYWHLAGTLTLIGVFAAIYHPVGIAMVAKGGGNLGRRLGVNGVWGNMGVAASALAIGAFVDFAGWRAAFFLLGGLSILAGVYWARLQPEAAAQTAQTRSADHGPPAPGWQRVLLVIGISAAIGGFIFNSMTVALPKVLDDRLATFSYSATEVGAIASAVYALAAFSQIVVGRAIDKHAIKPIFLTVTAGQAIALFIAVNLDGWAMVVASMAVMVLVALWRGWRVPGHVPRSGCGGGDHHGDSDASAPCPVRCRCGSGIRHGKPVRPGAFRPGTAAPPGSGLRISRRPALRRLTPLPRSPWSPASPR